MSIRFNSDSEKNEKPLIPDIAGVTLAVQIEMQKNSEFSPLYEIIKNHFTEDNRSNINIEQILSHIRALKSVAGKGSVRGLNAVELDSLDKKICQIIHGLVNKELTGFQTPYHNLARWATGILRTQPIEIFTTNYDLLMEQALEDCRAPYFDGFVGTRNPYFDAQSIEDDTLLPRQWTRFWKLHGSINWHQSIDGGVYRGTSEQVSSNLVIYPSHLKYEESRRMPYLALIDRLKLFMKKPTAVLVTVGYSFGDEHLNEVIIQGLEHSQTAITFALLFNETKCHVEATNLALKHTNLILLARDCAIVSGRILKWPETNVELLNNDMESWVKLSPIDPSIIGSKQFAEFLLGDFVVFGKFILKLIGNLNQTVETPNAK